MLESGVSIGAIGAAGATIIGAMGADGARPGRGTSSLSSSSDVSLVGRFDSKPKSSGMEGGCSRAKSSSSEYEASFIVLVDVCKVLWEEVEDYWV